MKKYVRKQNFQVFFADQGHALVVNNKLLLLPQIIDQTVMKEKPSLMKFKK
jgi:hypothetical protein